MHKLLLVLLYLLNTFFPLPLDHFAVCLDPTHLWKQVLEGTQLLTLLEDLDTIVEYYGWEKIGKTYTGKKPEKIASNYLRRCQWVKDTYRRYNKLDTRLAYILTDSVIKLVELPKSRCSEMITVYKHDKYEYDDEIVIVDGLRWYWRKDVFIHRLGERCITLGFVSHAAVRMWVGEQNGLRHYINVHLEEHLKRGGNAEMTPLTVTDPVHLPWWTECESVQQTHRASLYRKFHHPTRQTKALQKYKGWYEKYPEFKLDAIGEWVKHGYCWPCNLEEEVIVGLIKGHVYSPEEITVPITSDARPKRSTKRRN